MPGVLQAYPPEPDRIVDFIKLQVTDALLDTEIFPTEAPEGAASVLFALGVLSAIPPVPNNHALLEETFGHLQHQVIAPLSEGFIYVDIVNNYNRYLGVFEKSALLPKKGPMSNPYEEVSKAASYQLGFPDDGVRIFHLTVWLTHYCKDAISLFFAESLGSANKPRRTPNTVEAYTFVSKHVNNTITDPTFFSDGVPANATEIFTALYMLVALAMPLRDKSILYNTLEYTNSLLAQSHYPPIFFERMVQALERFFSVYETNMDAEKSEPNAFAFELLAEEAVKLMGQYPDTLLRFNIVAYFPVLFFDAMDTLYPEVDTTTPVQRF